MWTVISLLMLGQLMDEDPRVGRRRVMSTGKVGSGQDSEVVLARRWAQEEDVGECVLRDALHGGGKEKEGKRRKRKEKKGKGGEGGIK